MGFGFVFLLEGMLSNRFPDIIFKIPYIFICSCLLKIRRKLVYSSKVIAASVVSLLPADAVTSNLFSLWLWEEPAK